MSPKSEKVPSKLSILKAVADPGRLVALDAVSILDTPAEKGFDDIVRLAARLCATPVSLVSLVAADRQWFKARLGFPHCETDLSASVCVHALGEPDLLVIPDLTADPRTAANPLVTGEPLIRFYAGAPLRLSDGLVVGSLCVIDTVARPEGLSQEQSDDLRALGQQVSHLLELRRALKVRDEALETQRRLADTSRRDEVRNRLLFETIDAGFCVIEVRFEGVGDTLRAVDYRFLEANPAFEKQTGLVNAVGRWMRELAPNHEQHWFDIYGRVALTGEPARFENAAAALGRWYDVHALRVGEPHERQVALLFNDITARRTAELALQASEGRFRALVTAGAQSIYRMSPDWLEMRALDGAGFLIDTNSPSVRWLDRYTEPTDRSLVMGAIEEAIQRRDVFELEHRVRRADGGSGWTLSRAVPIIDDAGDIVEWFGTATDVSDRRAAQDALKTSEAHWRGLFERLSEGFIVGELIRDGAGQATDWRYIEVNQAWGDLVGVDARSVAGRTIREVFPGIEDEWVDEFADVVHTGEPITFTRQVGTISRWYEGRAFKLEGDRFGVIFLEVTERVEAEARRAALLSLGDRLRDVGSIGEMTRAASEIVGRTLRATRAGFGRIDEKIEQVEIEPDWTVDGMPSMAGRHRFQDFGDLRPTLLASEPLVIDDVTSDPRTRKSPEPLLAMRVAAQVNMPVRERGQTIAIFIVHDDKPRRWQPEELAFLRNVADRLEVAVARLRAEERQTVLNHELAHRLKNTLTIVQSMANQTLRNVSDREPVEAFERRVLALSQAHDVLLKKSWSATRLRMIMDSVLSQQVDLERFVFDGDDLDIGPQAALSISLLLHELATNALKYGALSSDAGRVRISWRSDTTDVAELILAWTESGGPPVSTPSNKPGFGSRLIRLGLLGTRKADIRYEPSGLRAVFRAPLAMIQQEASS